MSVHLNFTLMDLNLVKDDDVCDNIAHILQQ